MSAGSADRSRHSRRAPGGDALGRIGADPGGGARALAAAAILAGGAFVRPGPLAARTASPQQAEAAAAQPASAVEAYRSLRQGAVYRFTFDYRGGTRVQLPASPARGGAADTARRADERAAEPDSGRAAGPAASTFLEAHVTGTWRMRVYRWDHRGGGLLGWAAPSAQVTLRHGSEGLPDRSLPDEQRMEEQLAREVLLQIGPSGRVETMLLPRDLHPFVEAFWKRWADRALLRLPGDSGRTQWRSEGRERLGRYRDVYRTEEGGEIVRRRDAYLSLRTEAATPVAVAQKDRERALPAAAERRLRAESRYQVHPDHGYLATGSGTLALEIRPGGGPSAPRMLVVHAFELAPEGFEQREAAAVRTELAERYGVGGVDEMPHVLESTGPAEPADGAGRAPAPGEASVQALRPWAGLLDELERSLRAGDAASTATLVRQLRRHLKQDPARIDSVAARLEADTTVRTRGVLMDALAQAGTDPAQKALGRWIADGRDPATTRRALLSLTYLDNPSDDLYERVRELSGNGDAPPAVRREALRALGTLVARRGVRSFGPEGPVDVLEQLAEKAFSAESVATRRAAVHALGNTGLPTAVEPVRELASANDVRPGVLEAAVAALELIPSGTSVDALARLAEEHPASPAVQNRIVSALISKTRTGGPAARKRAREHLTALLRGSHHMEVRLQVLEHFIARMRRGDRSRARKIVRRAAKSNSVGEVRERARQALERAGPTGG